MEIPNLSNTEFKTLVIRMFKELIEYGNKIKKDSRRNEGYTTWNKEKSTENHSGGNEVRIQINNLEHKEKIEIQPEQQEEKRILKNEDSIKSLWDITKCTNIWTIGVPEGEEKEQEIEKIIKENFPNLVKEIDIKVQGAQRVPNKLDPKRNTPRHIIIQMPKIKDKERILKAEREKQKLPTGEFP